MRWGKKDIAANFVGLQVHLINSQSHVIHSFTRDAYHLLNTKFSFPHLHQITAARLTYFIRGQHFLSVQVPVLTDQEYWFVDPKAFQDAFSVNLRIDRLPNGTSFAFEQISHQSWPFPSTTTVPLNQGLGHLQISSDSSTPEQSQNLRDVHHANNEAYWQHYMQQRKLFSNPVEEYMRKRKPSPNAQRMYRLFASVPGVFTHCASFLLREYYQHIEYGLDQGRYTALNLLLLAASTDIHYQCEQVAYSHDLLLHSSLQLCYHTTVTQLDSAYYGQNCSKQDNDLRCHQCSTLIEIPMALSYVQKDRAAMQSSFSDILNFAKLFAWQASLSLWVDKVATRAAISQGIPETEWIKYGLVPYTLTPILSTVGVTGKEELVHARTSIWLQVEAIAARTALGCYFTQQASRSYSTILSKPARQMSTLGCGTKISVGKTTGALCSLKRMMAAVNEREDLKPSEYWKQYYGGFRKWALALISSLNKEEDKQVLEFDRSEPITDNWPLRDSVLLMHNSQESGNFRASAMAIDDIYEVGNVAARGWSVALTYMSAEEKEASANIDIHQQVRIDLLRELRWLGIGDERRAVFLRVLVLDPQGRHILHLHDVVDLNENGSRGTVLKVWRWYTSQSKRLLEHILTEDTEVKRRVMMTVRDRLVEIDGIQREGDKFYSLSFPFWRGRRISRASSGVDEGVTDVSKQTT